MRKKEQTIKTLEKYLEDIKKNEDKVKSLEYLKWLFDFTEKNNHWNDESLLYEKSISKKDFENAQLVSYFIDHVKEKACEQGLFSIEHENYCYDDEYNFKLLKNFYNIYSYSGQGTITGIKKLEKTPEEYVYMDEECPVELLRERELIEYIIINKDLDISPAKVAVHVGHACTIATINQFNQKKFERWYDNGKNQKKIILSAHEKDLEKLEEKFYSIRDNGFTEVKKGTLIAVSLGVMTRKEAFSHIKRLQLWK